MPNFKNNYNIIDIQLSLFIILLFDIQTSIKKFDFQTLFVSLFLNFQ